MRYIIYIFFVYSFVLKSQTTNNSVFTLKPSIGFNACQVHGDNYDGYNKFGGFGGLTVNAKVNTKISFDIGFYFSQKGAKHNQNPIKGDYSYYRLNLNYIDLPVCLKYNANSIYFLTLGPSVAYLINYSENINNVDYTGYYPFKKFEYGINFGLGRKIQDNFFVEVRTSNSFASIRDYGQIANLVFFPNPVARFFNKGFYNNILTLIVSYKLNFKNKHEPDSKS